MEHVTIIECPRDAWQGLPKIIPTETKIAYLAQLIRAGFRHIDAVSFVSPKYVPQMADSETVMQALRGRSLLDGVEIIGIVVNEAGFRRALNTPGVTAIGYPYSISETFSRQNANMAMADSRLLVQKMQGELATAANAPSLVVYISMAFGNPYGDPWQPGIVVQAIQWLKQIGLRAVSLADTVGKARAEDIGELFRAVKNSAPGIEVGVHLHSRTEGVAEKVLAAYEAGCRRFDSALTGLGGCPFAGDALVGNIPTEIVVATLGKRGVPCDIQQEKLAEVLTITQELRERYAG